MKFTVCNTKNEVLEEIDLDVLSVYTLGKVYNMPYNISQSVDFTTFDRKYDKGRYYSATFFYHLPNNILILFMYDSSHENKLIISYCFKKADGDVNMFAPPPTIETVKNVIYTSNAEEA